MSGVAEFLLGIAGKEITREIVDRLKKATLPDLLAKELEAWARGVKNKYGDVDPGYLKDVFFGNSVIPAALMGTAHKALTQSIRDEDIPSAELWYEALEERRQDAGEILREHPESVSNKRNSLFLCHKNEVADDLGAAAERLERVCQKDTSFFRVKMLKTQDTLNRKLDEVLRLNLEIQRLIPQSQQDTVSATPWELKHFVGVDVETDGPVAPVLKTGDWVTAAFAPKPSGDWKDPCAIVKGFWNEQSRVVSRFNNEPIKVKLRAGSEKPVSSGLCIPSYQTDVEWREKTLVQGPLWGNIKRHVVSQFLNLCKNKVLLCRVLFVGERRGRATFHLYSEDYDSWLKHEWPYFKGLEIALSRNDLYALHLSRQQRRHLIRERLKNNDLSAAFPERYRKQIGDRPIQESDAELILRGVIERFRLHNAHQTIPAIPVIRPRPKAKAASRA